MIEQSDATSWMGMYCLNMMTIALELSRENPAYEDVASKFLEHFVYISRAMNNIAGQGIELWDRTDGFYYDVLRLPDAQVLPDARALAGWLDSLVRGGNAGFRADRYAAGVQAQDAIFHR